MKRLSLYIGILGILWACDDILEEVPQDFISNVNFWQNEQDAEAGVKGIYGVDLIGPFDDQFLELHTDFAKGRGSWTSISAWDNVFDNTHIGRTQSYWWDRPYLAINRANSVLDNVPGINMDETKKSMLLAEARFMRAWNYFDLVRGFGPVPLRTSSTKDLSTINAPRATESEIYQQILTDLQIAEVDLPNSVGSDTRRASKWAAKLLLAQVYLTLEDWGMAAAKAEELIQSGEFAIIEVQSPDDFYKIFAERPTTEDVMSIHYASTQQDSYVYTLHQANIPEYNNNSRGFFTTLPVTSTIIGDDWDDNDLRKEFNLYTEYVNSSGEVVSLPEQNPILFKKYIAQPDGTRQNARYYLRYTEAYLIYAEAAAMDAGSPEPQALEYLNVIRRRAYGQDPFQSSVFDYPATMTLDEFRDAVIMERAYEFINEQRRWWDLKRTGKAKEAIEAAFNLSFNDARLFWPIPEDELNNNDDISQQDQNPGY